MNRFLAAFVVVASIAARAEEPAPERTAQILGFEEYRMPNGLRVILYADATAPKVTVNLTVLVGSVHEGGGEMGMAHVFEHVLFHSVEGFPSVAETLKNLGANYNGSTWFDRTNFFETVAATDENVEACIRMEAARLGRAVLNAEDLTKEGKIVESEFDIGRSNPQRLVVMGMFGAMYDFHAYSREPIGTLEDFKSLKVENIREFYRKYYRPDNAVLIVTGKFDTAKVLELVQKNFGGLKGNGEPRPGSTTREPASTGERRYVIRKPGEGSVVLAGYRVPGGSHPDSVVSDVFARMLVDGHSGPLYEAVVGKGLAGSIGANTITLRYASPFFILASVPKDKDADAAEAAILDFLEKKAGTLEEDDLERALGGLEKDFDDLFNDAESLAMALSEGESTGSWKLLLARREAAKKVTLEQVQAFAAKYIRRENRVVGRFIPDGEAVAVKLDVEPEPSTHDPLLAKLPPTSQHVREFDYSPANVLATVQWGDAGPAKVALVKKEAKGDKVNVRLFIPLASKSEIFPHEIEADALGSLMTEKTATLGKEQLKSKLAELKTEISVNFGLEGGTVTVSTTKQAFAEAMGIVREMLRTPALDEAAIKDYRTRTADQLRAAKDDPRVITQVQIPRMVFPEGDPRRGHSVEEQLAGLDALTLEAVKAFHADYVGAEGMIGAVVGDVERKDIDAALNPLVADWKAKHPGVIVPNAGVDKTQSNEARFETPGKPNALSILIQPVKLSRASEDYPAISAASSVLFEDGLSSRIPAKVRGVQALSYATGGSVQAEMNGDFGMVVLYSMTKPENAAKALDLIRSELAEAVKSGVTPEELAAHKKSYVSKVAQSRADDARLAASIVMLRAGGKDHSLLKSIDEATAKLTVDDVNAALKKYVDPAKLALLQVGDFEGGGKKKPKKEKEGEK